MRREREGEREIERDRESHGTLLPSLRNGAANGNLMTRFAHALTYDTAPLSQIWVHVRWVLHCMALGTFQRCRSFGLSSCEIKRFISGATAHHTGRIPTKEYHDARVELIWLSIAAMKKIAFIASMSPEDHSNTNIGPSRLWVFHRLKIKRRYEPC